MPSPWSASGSDLSDAARPHACRSAGKRPIHARGRAAALLHSIARNRALVDGNKRLSLAATIAFLGMNGRRLTLTNDEAYELVMKIATGELDEIADIAQRLRDGSRQR